MDVYLVGGAVRDNLLGLKNSDRDWVVVGATVAGVFFLSAAKKNDRQIQTVAKNPKDLTWLTVPNPNLAVSYEQFTLYISNTDPTRGDSGLLETEIVRNAYRFRSLAFQ